MAKFNQTPMIGLIQASSSVAAVVELHEHINDNGIMRMRKVEGGLALEANQSIIMKPGGYHIMLISLHKPLKAGDTMDLSLKFGSGKLIELSIPVVSIKKCIIDGRTRLLNTHPCLCFPEHNELARLCAVWQSFSF